MSDYSNKKKVVLSGAQPTNQFHLGNYMGAIKQWIAMSDQHECYYMIVDLHAISTPQDPKALRDNTLSCLAQYIACGLDPQKAHIFAQSHVRGHTELSWVLGSICSLGQLERMTQFKDKSSQQSARGFIGSGLLFYPVLQAADILLYDADLVPVGEDQKQHIELTRDLAERFNFQFGPTFRVPDVYTPPQTARIMSLQDPTKKMSKSDPNTNGTLFLLDSPAVLRKKLMSALTDGGSQICVSEEKPGISNLLDILSSVTTKPIGELELEFAESGYGKFKGAVADAVVDLCEGIQKRYADVIDDKPYLMSVLKKSAQAAEERASVMIKRVYDKVGFLSY
jgi:tryptophanyl-tRNA synthetase